MIFVDDKSYEFNLRTNGFGTSITSNCIEMWHDLHGTKVAGMDSF